MSTGEGAQRGADRAAAGARGRTQPPAPTAPGAGEEPVRLFVAVMPPTSVMNDIDALPRPALDRLRWTQRPTWHITLRFLGQERPAPVIAALRGTVLEAASVHLGPRVKGLGGHAGILPAAGLDGIARAVRRSTKRLGSPPDHKFRGHLTLARWRGRGRIPAGALGQPFEAVFEVHEIRLVQSVLRTEGPEHTTLATFAMPSSV